MIATLLTDSAFLLSIRWVLAAVFVVAVFHKLTSPASFVATLRAYRLLPDALTPVAAYALIAAEVGTAVALLVNSVVGSAAAVAILTVYTLAILANLLRGRRDIDCGCSGPYLRQTLSAWLIVRNVAFIALALLTLSPVTDPRALGILDWSTSLAAAVTFVLVYFAANQIASVNARYGR